MMFAVNTWCWERELAARIGEFDAMPTVLVP
jgi:hypothetical protein